jgi:HlyD family secretion protein
MVDGKAVCTPVKRGASDDTHSQILAGLNDGDVVVTGPFKVLEQIKHGDLLKIDDGSSEKGSVAKDGNGGGGPQVRVRM